MDNHWNRLDTYYKIRKQLSNVRDEYDDYCGMCYQGKCNHTVERIPYSDVLAELTWWGEVAIIEYPGKYTQVGEVTIFPTWPESKKFNPSFENEKYTVYPKIKGGVFGAVISHVGEITGYESNLQNISQPINDFAQTVKFGNGAYWGWLYENEFYLLMVYRNKWVNLRRLKNMPCEIVTGYTIPKFDTQFKIDGYMFVPNYSDNYNFQTKYFEVNE